MTDTSLIDFAIARVMTMPVAELNLSDKAKADLAAHGYTTVAIIWDAAAPVKNNRIPGITKRREDQVFTAFGEAGVPMKWWGKYRSHMVVGLEMRKLGIQNGKEEAAIDAMTQTLKFELVRRSSLDEFKTALLAAYHRTAPYVGFKVLLEYDVTGVGKMMNTASLRLPTVAVNKMLQDWHPTKQEPVVASSVIKLNESTPARKVDLIFNFETCRGELRLLPPDSEAQAMYAECFGERRSTD